MYKQNYLQKEQILLIKIKPQTSIYVQTELSPKRANIINKNRTPDINICTNRQQSENFLAFKL